MHYGCILKVNEMLSDMINYVLYMHFTAVCHSKILHGKMEGYHNLSEVQLDQLQCTEQPLCVPLFTLLTYHY